MFSRHQFTQRKSDHRLYASQLRRNLLRDHLVESLISEAVEQPSLGAQGSIDSWSKELAFSFLHSLINMHGSHQNLPLTETLGYWDFSLSTIHIPLLLTHWSEIGVLALSLSWPHHKHLVSVFPSVKWEQLYLH